MSYEDVLRDPEARRDYEEERLFGEAVANIEGLLDSLSISRRKLADRLGVSAGRVSQLLSGKKNLTLRTLASLAWALGYEFDIRIRPMSERSGTPAADDPSDIPDWVWAQSDRSSLKLDPAHAFVALEAVRPAARRQLFRSEVTEIRVPSSQGAGIAA